MWGCVIALKAGGILANPGTEYSSTIRKSRLSKGVPDIFLVVGQSIHIVHQTRQKSLMTLGSIWAMQPRQKASTDNKLNKFHTYIMDWIVAHDT